MDDKKETLIEHNLTPHSGMQVDTPTTSALTAGENGRFTWFGGTTLYAVTLMLISGFCLGLCAAIIQWGSNLGFSSMEMLMWRSGMQCVVAVISSILTFQAKSEWEQFRSLTKHELIYLILRGLSGGIGVASYFHGITLIPVGDAITVLSIYPVIAAFLAYFILKEHITMIHFLALIFAVLGLILISQPSFIPIIGTDNDSNSGSKLLGYGICLFGGIIGGVVFIFIVKAKNAPTTSLVCSQGIFCFIIAIILCSSVQHFSSLKTWKDVLCFFALSMGGFVAQWTFNAGAKQIPAGLSSLLRSTDTIWSYIWQIIWFKDIPNYITIIGAIGVISGVAMVSFEKIRRKKAIPVRYISLGKTPSIFNMSFYSQPEMKPKYQEMPYTTHSANQVPFNTNSKHQIQRIQRLSI